MEHDRSDEFLSQGWSRGFAGSFRFSDTPHGSGDNAFNNNNNNNNNNNSNNNLHSFGLNLKVIFFIVYFM